MSKVTKKEISNYLKKHPFINGDAKISKDGSITITINLGPEAEKEMSKTDLILESLKEIKSDINQLKSDVNELKFDVNELKSDVNQLKTDVKDIKTRLDIIESLPTIKKELDSLE